MSKYKEIDLSRISKYSIKSRKSKVNHNFLAKNDRSDPSDFIDSLPDLLKAKDLKELIDRTVNAYKSNKPVIVGLGGHVIKCGLSLLIIELMKMGLIKAILSNGSVLIHDFELSCYGNTSEDVDSALEDGSFGMAEETGAFINEAISEGYQKNMGLGEAVGYSLSKENFPHQKNSIVREAYLNDIPFTVHVAIGTDIIHQHDNCQGEAVGACSHKDFKIFCQNIIDLHEGGVFINFGSAVIIPEVFLKALTVVRNIGYPLNNFYTAVFDMNFHYRPNVNIVHRPVSKGGKGFYFIGHHEIMIPLFLKAVKEKILGLDNK